MNNTIDCQQYNEGMLGNHIIFMKLIPFFKNIVTPLRFETQIPMKTPQMCITKQLQ